MHDRFHIEKIQYLLGLKKGRLFTIQAFDNPCIFFITAQVHFYPATGFQLFL